MESRLTKIVTTVFAEKEAFAVKIVCVLQIASLK